MGTPHYAQAILEGLIQDKNIEVVAVYTQPDKPVGRKKVLTPPPVKESALLHNIALYQPLKLRESQTLQDLLSIECDYIVVAAYGQILPKEILEHAPCINLHASLLPHYRGASPIQQTLLNGDSVTGITAMLMEEGLDTGPILTTTECSVDSGMMLEELFEHLTQIAKELTLEVLNNFSTYVPQPQLESSASYCKKITKSDGEVDFTDASVLYNMYRAFTPWPGIYLSSGLKLKKIALENMQMHEDAGVILSVDKDSIVVSCQKGSIRIFSVQPVSKNEMDVISYINGKRLKIADRLS